MNRTKIGLLLLIVIGVMVLWLHLSAGAAIDGATRLSGAGSTALGSVTLNPDAVQPDQAALWKAEQNFSAALSLLNGTLAIEPAQQKKIRSLTLFSSGGLELARADRSFISGDRAFSNLSVVLGQGKYQDLKPALLETRGAYNDGFSNLTAAGGDLAALDSMAGSSDPQVLFIRQGVAGTDRYKEVVLFLDGYDHLVNAVDDRATADAAQKAGRSDLARLALRDAEEELQMAAGIFSGARESLVPVIAGQAGPGLTVVDTLLGEVRADQQQVGGGL